MWFASCLAVCALALPLGAHDEWKHIFNGKDMSGWEHVGPGHFTVEKGMLKTHGGMGLLWYAGEPIGNAVLRVVFKTVKWRAGRLCELWRISRQAYSVSI